MTDYLDALEGQLVDAVNQRTDQARRARAIGGWVLAPRLVVAAGLLLSVVAIALVAGGWLGAGSYTRVRPVLPPPGEIGISGDSEAQAFPPDAIGRADGLVLGAHIVHAPIQDLEVLGAWPVVVHFAAARASAVNVTTG